MKPLLLAAALAGLHASLPRAAAQYVCEIPTSGCSNGMFNQATCECECISPFCHDLNGDCTNPSGNCGGNPWADCVRGVDCPWWVNPLKAESCTTGPEVPPGLWQIYNTKPACCNTNFPYSNVCQLDRFGSSQPTKHPTISRPDDDVYEIVPIKFDVGGLPDEVDMRDLKEEMLTVMKRILLRLADRVPGLKVSSVEEKAVLNRHLLRAPRALEKSVTLYYNVYVIRDDRKKFGPLIIQEIRDSYDEVLEQIQTFTDTTYFGGDLDVNWCTSQNGKFELCVNDNDGFRRPVGAPTVYVQSDPPPDDGGLAGWAVALIVIVVLLLVACIGYGVWVSCYRDGYDKNKEIETNIYFDSRGRGASFGEGRASRAGRSRRSRRSRSAVEQHVEDAQIVLADHQEARFDDDSFTLDTYGNDDAYGDRAKKSRKTKKGRDPTMYVPGQEDRPDPDADMLRLTDGYGRRYLEDPPLKPKREPTMYVDGESQPDPTLYIEGAKEEVNSRYSQRSDPSFRTEEPELEAQVRYTTDERNAEYNRGRRDPSYYDEGAGSFAAPERSVKSGRSRRSKKGRKSGRRE